MRIAFSLCAPCGTRHHVYVFQTIFLVVLVRFFHLTYFPIQSSRVFRVFVREEAHRRRVDNSYYSAFRLMQS